MASRPKCAKPSCPRPKHAGSNLFCEKCVDFEERLSIQIESAKAENEYNERVNK